ncbi:DUF4255 domain-containing protein [Pedobacter sp. L105]|uniref:DUF4255 domain-containing protein n=1 Tax=Pedobacter sp. L105 TaxID=1641871 RepID=UPI00131BB4C0|nr:DUF4255 domain-containing protein [Pedobacter sp. L105]
MIYECLTCLAEEMNIFFRSRLKINEDKVMVSAIVNQDGSIAIQGENKILITLINIVRDVNMKRETPTGAAITGNAGRPICIQLYLMVSCYFSASNYGEALRFLSFVIGFLQEKNVFDHTNTPRLDDSIDKLVFELESFEPERLSNIWSTLGAKYMPSVFYKVRMIIYDSNKVQEYRPVVSGITADNLLK